MVEKFNIFHIDKHVGILIHDTDGDKYAYESVVDKNDSQGQLVIDILNADKDSDWFRDTIYSTRLFPKNRIDAREILNRLDMFEYNRWELLKRGKFMSDDCIWMSEDSDGEWFWTHHPLACVVPGYTEKTEKPMFTKVFPTDDTDIY